MRIIEEKLQWEKPVDGYQYKIKPSEQTPEGDAQLIYKNADETIEEVRSVLLAHGLQLGDRIVQLNEFYPNGRGLDEEVGEGMRKGVGTSVLADLEVRAIAQGAKAVYAFSMKPSMQSFLKKMGFEVFGPKNCHHIKILEKQTGETTS